MTRLSDPESVLKKISDIYEQIDMLYETVDLVKKFKDKFNEAFENSQTHENRLTTKVFEFNELQQVYEKIIQDLVQIHKASESHLNYFVTEFGYEKTALHKALQNFNQDRQYIETQYNAVHNKMNQAVSEMTSLMAFFTKQFNEAIDNTSFIAMKAADEGRQIIQRNSDDLNLMSTQIYEEVWNLEDELKVFKNHVSSCLKRKFGEFNELRIVYKQAVQAFMTANMRLDNDFLQLMADFSNEHKEIYKQHKILDYEKAKAVKDITTQAAYLEDQLTQKIYNTQIKAVRTVDSIKKLIQRNIDDMLFVSMEIKEQFFDLEADFLFFQKTIKANLKRKFKKLNLQNQQIQKFSQDELKHIKNEFNQEKFKIQDLIKTLNNERQQIQNHQQSLDNDVNQAIKHINNNMAAISEKSEQEIQNTKTQAKEIFDENKQKIEKQIKHITQLSDANIKKSGELEKDLKAFQTNISDNLQQRLENLDETQKNLEKQTQKTIDVWIKENSNKLEQQRGQSQDQIKKQINELEILKADYQKAVKDLDKMLNLLDNRQKSITAEFDTVKAQVKQDINTQLSAVSEKSEQEIKNTKTQAKEIFDEYKQKIEKQIKQITQLSDANIKKSGELEKDLKAFQTNISENLQQKFENLDETQKKLEKQTQKTIDVWIKENSNKLEHQSVQNQDQIKKQINELETLKADYQKSLIQSEKIFNLLEYENVRIKTEFEQEKTANKNMLAVINHEQKVILDKYKINEHEIAKTIKDITTQMAYISYQYENIIQNTKIQAQQIFDENKQKIQNELDRTGFIANEIFEQFADLEENLKALYSRNFAKTELKFEKIDKQQNDFYVQTSQKLNKRFLNEMESLQSWTQKFSEHQTNIQKQTAQAFMTKLSQEILKLQTSMNANIDKNINEKIDAINQKIPDTDQLTANIHSVEKQLSDIEENNQNNQILQQKQQTDIKIVLKKLYEGHKVQMNAIKIMEQRIKAMESRFKEN